MPCFKTSREVLINQSCQELPSQRRLWRWQLTLIKTSKKLESSQCQNTTQPIDPNIVDWDGDDDPEKPLNWPNSTKWRNIFTISALTLLTPFGSTMFAPAVPNTMRTLHSDNVDLASFVVSVYVLGYAFGPLVIGPLSELYGRLWLYHINTALFIIFNIACALAPNLSGVDRLSVSSPGLLESVL